MMVQLAEDVKIKFYQILEGDIELADFELWLYSNGEIESLMSEMDYYELISFNYKGSKAKYELNKLLTKSYVDISDYERWRLLDKLNTALEIPANLPEILIEFYELYCCGYEFLSDLGTNYGLVMQCEYYTGFSLEKWKGFDFSEREEYCSRNYPELFGDISKVLSWLNNKEIVPLGSRANENGYDYIDNRIPEESPKTKDVIVRNENNNLKTNKLHTNKNKYAHERKRQTSLWDRFISFWVNS